jgi:hypothetical protein
LGKLLVDEIEAVNQIRRTDSLVEFSVPSEADIAELLSPGSEAPLREVLDTLKRYYDSMSH